MAIYQKNTVPLQKKEEEEEKLFYVSQNKVKQMSNPIFMTLILDGLSLLESF